ncbi:MAG: siderophore-interacting protein, partial [Pseudomonadota bacterium]
CAGAHFKLVVPSDGQSSQSFAELISAGDFKQRMRTYTVRAARPAIGEIDVDIVTHGDLGYVGPWAQRALEGDVIVVSRCGTPKLITGGINRIIAAADMTGFPALAAGLETLEEKIDVEAFVEIATPGDRQPFETVEGVKINWIVKPDCHAPGTEIIEAIKNLPPPDEQTSVFVAGEFSTVGQLRQYFKTELGVDKSRSYISSYWKAGLDEPAHKIAKAAV